MRCSQCRKKIAVLWRGFPCRCGLEFCQRHRLPFEHNCSHDHKKAQAQKIASNNPTYSRKFKVAPL